MTDDFAAPPAPHGSASGTVKREDFRPATPPRRRGRFPRWLAVLLTVGGLVIVGSVVAQVMLTSRNANLVPADPDATGRLHSAQLVAGMCIEELGDGASPVTVVPCDEPHAAEVVTVITLPGDDYPGDAEVAHTVLEYCASQLAAGGPLAEETAGRDWVAWVPSPQTWRAGDRSGLCIVHSAPSEGQARA